jgi:hypothetical protein
MTPQVAWERRKGKLFREDSDKGRGGRELLK